MSYRKPFKKFKVIISLHNQLTNEHVYNFKQKKKDFVSSMYLYMHTYEVMQYSQRTRIITSS